MNDLQVFDMKESEKEEHSYFFGFKHIAANVFWYKELPNFT